MSTQMKLIIPLLDDKFTSFIVSDKAGFINAYTWNKNKPYIDNCIFLMYDATIINKDTQLRDHIIYNSPNLYKKENVIINKHYYTIYAICIIDSDIKEFLQGLRHKKTVSASKIMSFWGGKDEKVNKYLMGILSSYTCTGESVPEEDYEEPRNGGFHKRQNPEGLKIGLRDFCLSILFVIRLNTIFMFKVTNRSNYPIRL